MKKKNVFSTLMAGMTASLCAAAVAVFAPAQAQTPQLTEMSNGLVLIKIDRCIIYYKDDRLYTRGSQCSDYDARQADEAFWRWKNEQGGGSYRGGDEYSNGGSSYGSSSYSSDRITCESSNGRREYCRADIGNGSVRLTDRKSSARCDQGDDWNYDNQGIWVDNGCRAEFTISRSGGSSRNSYGSNTPGDEYSNSGSSRSSYGSSYERVTCESSNDRYKYCRANVGNRRVELVDRKSSSRCDKGEDWNYDNNGIWVDHGCRAEFEIR